MSNQSLQKIITEKELKDIVSYCEEQPVPFKFLKPIIQYIQDLPDVIDDKDKKSK